MAIWNVARWLVAGVVIVSCAARGYGLDSVETGEGQRVVGKVAIAEEGAVVQGEDGHETKVEWAKIKEMARDSVPKAEQKGTGTGLKGEYFSTGDLKELKAVQIDPAVDFEWSGRPPATAQWRDWAYFGARWTGKLEPQYSETYQFSAASGERRIRVWVAGKAVVDQWHNDAERPGTINLKAGEKVDIRVEMEQAWGASYARVYWQSASQPRDVVPADRCFLPEGFGAGDVEKYLLARANAGAVKAEYFEDETFTKVKRVQLERPGQWSGFVQPEPGVQTAKTAARWTMVLVPTRTDHYTLSGEGDWGRPTRLWVDGKMVTDNWGNGDTVERGKQQEKHHTKLDMEAGKRYEVKLETMRFGAGAVARIDMTSPHMNWRPLQAEDCVIPDDMPRVAVVEPYGETVLDGREGVELKAVVGLSPAVKGAVKKVEFYQGDKLVGTAEREPYVVKFERPVPDANVIVARVVMDTDVVARSEPVRFFAVVPAENVGEGWRDWQIGGGGTPMAIEKDGDKLVLTSRQGDLTGSDDAMRFVHRPLEGDGEILAKIDGLEGKKDTTVMGGVSLRESLATGARAVSLVVTSKGGATGGAMVIHRGWEGPTGGVLEVQAMLPCWVKLARTGDQVRAYVRPSGEKWKQVSELKVNWGTQTFAGLVALGDGDSGNRVVLEQVKLRDGGVAMAATREGVILRTGSFLAGEILRADGQTVVLKRDGVEKKFGTVDLAMVVFNPLSAATIESMASGKVGAVVAGGDFFDGELQSFKQRQATVMSVVFGSKTFETREVAAIVLHDGVVRQANWVVELADGSRLLAKSLKIGNGKIVVEDVGGEIVAAEGAAVRRITAEK